MSKRQSSSTEDWVEQLSREQLPVLSGIMQELNAVTQSSDSSAAQLSEIILKDSSLTTKVLRIANSAYHHPNSTNAITTISRAVVQLGFQGIKAISLSVMLIDSLLKEKPKDRMLEWMARGFHTAIQAENLLIAAGNNQKEEEVFITSLMLHVGEMAFWTCRSDAAKSLHEKLVEGSAGDIEAEQAILGCSMKDISIGLSREWQLGHRLDSALSPGPNPGRATEAVLVGEEISFAAEKGWESPEFTDVLIKVSHFTGLGLLEAKKLIERGASQAAGVAVTYGANKVCNFIPTPGDKPAEREVTTMQADPQLQLDILREMGSMVEKNVDINTLFQMVVEGIHRGVGLERVAICLVNVKANTMAAKYVLGEDIEEWRADFQFPVNNEQDNIFAYCLQRRQNIWINDDSANSLDHLINKKMKRIMDVENCLVSPLYAGNRPIGILIADKGKDGVAITTEQHESFNHFSHQTNMSLSMLAGQAKR